MQVGRDESSHGWVMGRKEVGKRFRNRSSGKEESRRDLCLEDRIDDGKRVVNEVDV